MFELKEWGSLPLSFAKCVESYFGPAFKEEGWQKQECIKHGFHKKGEQDTCPTKICQLDKDQISHVPDKTAMTCWTFPH